MGLSGGDLVLVGDSAEDLFSADPVPGEVDLWWSGVSLSRRELAKGTVRPGRVVVAQVLGQHLAQMVLIDDQQPVKDLWVPKTSSTSRDQAIFVDQATDASLSSDAVLLEIDRFG